MKRKTPKAPVARQREAWKKMVSELLAELSERLGADAGAAYAKELLSECTREVFGPERALDLGVARRRASSGPSARSGLRFEYGRIIGQSPAIVNVLRTLDRVVDSDLPVLITGESGTGKELIARAIHDNGARASRVFVGENCAAIPETLLESELFGYRRGAFTGANQDKTGLLEQGHRGSVFLDEIGEMSLGMQSKLMRVLQEGEVRPVGSPTSIHVDVRLISATNRDLRKLVTEGRFREDLFFRLNVIPIHLPPLRERREDIPLLVDAFLKAASERAGRPPKRLDPAAMECLIRHRWPGNVRELENEIHRAFALSGPAIHESDLSLEVQGPAPRKAPKRAASRSPRSRELRK